MIYKVISSTLPSSPVPTTISSFNRLNGNTSEIFVDLYIFIFIYWTYVYQLNKFPVFYTSAYIQSNKFLLDNLGLRSPSFTSPAGQLTG